MKESGYIFAYHDNFLQNEMRYVLIRQTNAIFVPESFYATVLYLIP